MEKLDLLDLYKLTKNMNILLQFKGALSQEILLEMSDLINKQSSFDKAVKSSFAVFVELSQNIMNYSSEREMVNNKEIGVGIILFIENENSYIIYSGNLMLTSKKQKLIEALEKINKSNEEELKQMYKEQRRREPSEDSKGAGLGLIDIARRSKNSISYKIDSIDENNSFLVLSVEILKEK